MDETMKFNVEKPKNEAQKIIYEVYAALKKKDIILSTKLWGILCPAIRPILQATKMLELDPKAGADELWRN